MFDLNKIINIIKENGREVFLVKENEDPLVLMSISRYRELTYGELIGKNNSSSNSDNFINDIDSSASLGPTEEDYPGQIKKTIMPELDA